MECHQWLSTTAWTWNQRPDSLNYDGSVTKLPDLIQAEATERPSLAFNLPLGPGRHPWTKPKLKNPSLKKLKPILAANSGAKKPHLSAEWRSIWETLRAPKA